MSASSVVAVESIAHALSRGTGTMAKRFLQAHGLPRGAGDANAELAERIVRYAGEGKISHQDVERLLREMLEYGEKRVYILRGDTAKMGAVSAASFGGAAVSSLDGVRIQRAPKSPTLNYALVTDTHIRLNYTETHTFLRVDRAHRVFTETQDTCVVIVEADLKSGLVTIAFDSPGQSAHGLTVNAYFDYYLHNEAPAMLGTDLVSLEYYNLLHSVEKVKYRDLVRPALVRGQDKVGLGLSYVGQGTADLRDYATFQQSRGSLAMRKSARLVWKRTQSAQDDLASVRAGKALLRDVTTMIYAAPAMVHFERHTLSHEMEHVLREIRSIT